jgi:hypothetical protein
MSGQAGMTGRRSAEDVRSAVAGALVATSTVPGAGLVRPYAVTGGRTKPRYQLQVEAMVAAWHYAARDLAALSPECQAILGFCRDWRSVAEISAVLRMPLGVARVPVADMALEGQVRVHQMDQAHGRPDLNLLERVLSGLRKLWARVWQRGGDRHDVGQDRRGRRLRRRQDHFRRVRVGDYAAHDRGGHDVRQCRGR